MAETLAHPVTALREHARALEAAMSVCLAKPTRQRVHELRTGTRRIEAAVVLLEHLPEIPAHGDEAAAVLRQLRYVRRAAGRVRDLDVQRKLLKDEVLKGGRFAGAEAEVCKGAEKLRRHGKAERKLQARKLIRTIERRQARISGALEEVIEALASAEDAELSPSELIREVDQSFRAERPALAVEPPSENDLHDTRKLAKRARYQSEEALGSPVAQGMAERFEQLQKTGGDWHDWLEIARRARKVLGKRHPATEAFTQESGRQLARYRGALSTLSTGDSPSSEEAAGHVN